jgi:hypothetical protein
LYNQSGNICRDEDARVPLGLDQRHIFSSGKSDCSSEHHVDRCCEEQGTDEEEDALGDEGSPGLVVEVGADTCTVASDFAYTVLVFRHMIGVVWSKFTESPNDHIDDNSLTKSQKLHQVKHSHDEEDDQSYDCAYECWNVTVHLPVELRRAWWVGHFDDSDLSWSLPLCDQRCLDLLKWAQVKLMDVEANVTP